MRSIISVLLVIVMPIFGEWDMEKQMERPALPNLEGSWELDVTSSPGPGAPPPFKALATFDSGGGVIETILFGPIVPAHGVWARRGPEDFEFTVVHPLLDAGGKHYATIRATSQVHISETNANELTGTFEGAVFDLTGNVLAPISGTETGTRILLP